MARNRTGVVVVPEHDAKPLRGRKTALPRVPQYKFDENIESLLSHFTVYFDSIRKTHVVPVRPRWSQFLGYKKKTGNTICMPLFVMRVNGIFKKISGNSITYLNGDAHDYRLSNLLLQSPFQTENERLIKEGKKLCSRCRAIKPVVQFCKTGNECRDCQRELRKIYLAEKTKQTTCKTCGCTFDAKGRNLRYCSEVCRIEIADKRKSQAVGSRECEHCGKTFTIHSKQHKQKHCSRKCQRETSRKQCICEQCGKEYLALRTRQRFCSTECKYESRRTYHECEGCGKTFQHRPSSGPGKDDNRFCDKQCCAKWRKRQTAARRQAEHENLFLPYSLTVYKYSQKLDAKLCAYLRKQLKPLQNTLQRKQLANWLKNGPCEECGKPKGRTLNTKGENKYFCRACASKLTFWEFSCERCGCDAVSYKKGNQKFCQRCQKRRQKKRSTHLKRCEKRGLPYDPAVKTSEVGERANWHCEICQKAVMRVWKTHGPNQKPYDLGPTIDHIVPLLLPENTKHGHTWENTQLACWRCNTDKNDDCESWLTECDDPRRAIGLGAVGSGEVGSGMVRCGKVRSF